MSSRFYELSIEEVAYAMGVLGGTEVATGFLLALLGERPRLEIEGRLLAASHALVARGYLDFNPDTGEKWLEQDLKTTIEPMVKNDYSLRCSKATESGEEVITFFVASDMLIKHHLQRSVVSVIETLPDWKVAVGELVSFFELSRKDAENDLIATVPGSLFDLLRLDALLESARDAMAALMKHGVSESEADTLLNDLQNSVYRGSIVKLGSKEERTASDKGLLLLKGRNRPWLFVIGYGGSPMMSIYSASIETFKQQFESLVSPS